MISEFKDNEIRRTGVVYRSTFNQIKKIYETDPMQAGELAISAIELVLTGDISSDDSTIDIILEQNRELNQKNKEKYDIACESKKQKKILDQKLEDIARLYLRKYTQKEIAQQLDLSQQTVSNRLATIRKECPELLQEEEKNTCKIVQEENTCTSNSDIIQEKNTCTNLQEKNTCTNLVQTKKELVQKEKAKNYNTFNF